MWDRQTDRQSVGRAESVPARNRDSSRERGREGGVRHDPGPRSEEIAHPVNSRLDMDNQQVPAQGKFVGPSCT